MKKFINIFIAAAGCLLILLSFTACGKTAGSDIETSDSADSEEMSSIQIEECKFDPEEVADDIEDFARNHGLRTKNRLCYRSDSYVKIDVSRTETSNDLLRTYQDAIYDIVANGNKAGANNIFFNIETVLTDNNGYFIVYISYEYE